MLETTIIFLIGLFVGSFLNVLADRLPREESVIKGRSHCEKCKRIIKWNDLIPLLSFLMLKGKCRYCYTRISFYYPIVEVVTGALFALVVIFVSQESIMHEALSIRYVWELFYYLFIVSSLIVIFFADLKHGIIPDKIIFPAVITSFLYQIFNAQYSIPSYLFSAIGACLFFLFLYLVTKGRGMGFGDVKFAFLMGLILGFPNIVVGLYVAFLTGAVAGCILIIWKKKKIFGTSIPFGPFLALGTLVAIFYGKILMQSVFYLVSL